MLSTNTWLKIICSMQINAIIFGIGIVVVLATPVLAVDAKIWIPLVVATSFILAPFIAAVVAPRMRIREWGKAGWKRGDVISG